MDKISITERLKKVKANLKDGQTAVIRNGLITIIEPFSGNLPNDNGSNGCLSGPPGKLIRSNRF